MTNQSIAPPSLAQLVAAREDIGDQSIAVKAAYDKIKEDLDAKSLMIDDAIRAIIAQSGGKSQYLPDGTRVTRSTNHKINITNWDQFDDLIRRTGNLRFVQKRAGKGEVLAHIQSLLPDGVKISDYYDGTKDPSKLPKLPVPDGVELYTEYNISVHKKGK